jgi:hypothetical protein
VPLAMSCSNMRNVGRSVFCRVCRPATISQEEVWFVGPGLGVGESVGLSLQAVGHLRAEVRDSSETQSSAAKTATENTSHELCGIQSLSHDHIQFCKSRHQTNEKMHE